MTKPEVNFMPDTRTINKKIFDESDFDDFSENQSCMDRHG